MNSKKKILLVAAAVLLLLGLGLSATWLICDWPPPRLILRYGLPPAGEPTGETVVIEGIEFVLISPGYFQMGSHSECNHGGIPARALRLLGFIHEEEANFTSNECPPHWVEHANGFGISRMEISNEQYWRFDSKHVSLMSAAPANVPVTNVSIGQAQRFCEWLSARSGRRIRLPSEAEWEAACRAGEGAEYGFGEDADSLRAWGFFSDNSDGQKQPVGQLRPNSWGLFDFHGNVAEWCKDRYHDSYVNCPTDGAPWTKDAELTWLGKAVVIRGGCYYNGEDQCRSAARVPFGTEPCPYVGLRLVLEQARE